MEESFNASTYLLDRHIENGGGDRLALTGVRGELTYAELHDRVRRTAGGLRRAGLLPEQRLLMFMADSPEFVTVFLAALRIGAVPVPVSTMMRVGGLTALLADSRAPFLALTAEFSDLGTMAAAGSPSPVRVLGPADLEALASSEPDDTIYPTVADSPAFWLYTSGTTGKPKGAMHRHGAIRVVCETYGRQVLGIRKDDRCLSAAKAFFAYGLGNSLLFPLAVGAAAVLEPAPSRPDVIAERAQKYGATLFFGGPTFFAGMLRSGLSGDALAGVRLAASAGEPLPAELYHRWTGHFGVDIIDGIGMTEMLHIFLSNRPGDVRPGTTGVAVPGYDLRILDDEGYPVAAGEPGTLFVRGDSTATGYWCRYATSRQVFQGEWLRTGDTYIRDEEGFYHCLGRTDDVLKVSGMWVAPAEVENRLLAHPGVAQAVVVAAPDADELDKPVAFVIRASPSPAAVSSDAAAVSSDAAAVSSDAAAVSSAAASTSEEELIAFCRDGMESYKRPRRVVFVSEYPTTATGKVRRVELRATAAEVLKG